MCNLKYFRWVLRSYWFASEQVFSLLRECSYRLVLLLDVIETVPKGFIINLPIKSSLQLATVVLSVMQMKGFIRGKAIR